jgi:hypothetical protein
LSTHQQRLAEILTQLIAGKLSTADAAQLLRVSHRQVQRLRRRFLNEGVSVAVHGNSGRAPVNRTGSVLIERLRALCRPQGKCRQPELLLVISPSQAKNQTRRLTRAAEAGFMVRCDNVAMRHYR